jgi:TPR repeat protein
MARGDPGLEEDRAMAIVRWALAAALLLAALPGAAQPSAATAVAPAAGAPAPAGSVVPTECDLLAGDPSDPDKAGPGVAAAQLRAWNDSATLACLRAVQADPGSGRLHYNLGRALFERQERHTEAQREFRVAAEQHHRQAQFVLGLLYSDGVPGELAADACAALPLWRDAADRGHAAARVSLARAFVRGQYRACATVPSRATVEAYIAAAAAAAEGDYYERLLIADLRERLAAAAP